jgi:hypothetical protein
VGGGYVPNELRNSGPPADDVSYIESGILCAIKRVVATFIRTDAVNLSCLLSGVDSDIASQTLARVSVGELNCLSY